MLGHPDLHSKRNKMNTKYHSADDMVRRWARDRQVDKVITPVTFTLIALGILAPGLLGSVLAGVPLLAAHAVRVACAAVLVFAVSFWVVRGRQRRRLEAVGAHAVALGRRLLLWASVAAGFPCLVVAVVAPSAVRTNSMFLIVLAIVVLAISGALWATRLAAPVR